MDVNLPGDEAQIAEPRPSAARSSKQPRKRVVSASAGRGQAVASQVSLTLPKELIEVFDQVSRDTGVNRAHLMREALNMYAGVLASGQRVYQLPGIRRVA